MVILNIKVFKWSWAPTKASCTFRFNQIVRLKTDIASHTLCFLHCHDLHNVQILTGLVWRLCLFLSDSCYSCAYDLRFDLSGNHDLESELKILGEGQDLSTAGITFVFPE